MLFYYEIHEAHVKSAQETDTNCEHLHHFYVNTGYPPYLVHDLFEGIVPFELALCLRILISKKYFSLECLNKLILNFPYKWGDKKKVLN